jgi:type II secretory pathway pseudopilin PulG
MTLYCTQCGTANELSGPQGTCSKCGAAIQQAAPPGANAGASSEAARPTGVTKRTSKLAIAALVCSLLVCLPGLNMLLGVGLGIAALVVIGKSGGRLGGNGLAVGAFIVSGVTVPIIGIMAAIAIPNFIRYQERAKMSEAKANLHGLATAEIMYYTDHSAFAPMDPVPARLTGDLTAVGPDEGSKELQWKPEGRVRFQYRAVVTGTPPDQKVLLTADGYGIGTDENGNARGDRPHAEIEVTTNGIGEFHSSLDR